MAIDSPRYYKCTNCLTRAEHWHRDVCIRKAVLASGDVAMEFDGDDKEDFLVTIPGKENWICGNCNHIVYRTSHEWKEFDWLADGGLYTRKRTPTDP